MPQKYAFCQWAVQKKNEFMWQNGVVDIHQPATADLSTTGQLETAIEKLRQQLAVMGDPLEACELSEDLSQLYEQLAQREKSEELHAKAAHYGRLAGEGYIHLGLTSAALRVHAWLRQDLEALEDAHHVLSQFAFAFGRTRAKPNAEDDRPPPTPFQDLKASVVLENDHTMLNRVQLVSPATKTFSVFSQFKPVELEVLLETSDYQVFDEGESLFSEGQAPEGFFFLLEGQVHKVVHKVGRKVTEAKDTLRSIRPDDFVGDLCFFSGLTHRSELQAATSGSLLFFEKKRFKSLIADYPRLKEKFYQIYERRLTISCLRENQLFKQLPWEVFFDFCENALATQIPKGRVVTKLDQRADRFFFVVHGKARSCVGVKEAGSLMGLHDYLKGQCFSQAWQAESELFLLEWRRDFVMAFLSRFPAYQSLFAGPIRDLDEDDLLFD